MKPQKPSLIKLKKTKNIKFSREKCDFSTFMSEFREILVPNKDISEVGLHLKQAVPKKHLYLIERFKLNWYQEMMEELEKKLGGSRKIFLL